MSKKKGCKKGHTLFKGNCVELGMHSLSNTPFKSKIVQVKGNLTKTNRKVKPIRYSSRSLYKDKSNQLWAIINGKLWRFPQEIEY